MVSEDGESKVAAPRLRLEENVVGGYVGGGGVVVFESACDDIKKESREG